jgi:hypothetical protein
MRSNSAPATSVEANPPKPLNSATSCGMAVIWIRTARVAPITPPITIPRAISPSESTSVSVTSTAINMPAAPQRLPRTAVRG